MPDGAVVPGLPTDDAAEAARRHQGVNRTGRQTGRPVPAELMESLRRMYGTGVAGGSARSAERIRSEVFRPSHILPTMTVEQAGEIERREMMERQRAQAENAARRAREESEMTRGGTGGAGSGESAELGRVQGRQPVRTRQQQAAPVLSGGSFFFFFGSHSEAIALS